MRTKKKSKPKPTQSSSTLTRQAALHTGRVVKIPGHPRTKDDIEREIAALPPHFTRSKIPPLVVLREAEELLRRRDDVPLFADNGIDVTAGHFQLIADLSALLRDAAGIRDLAGAVYNGYVELESAYAEQLRRDVRRLRLLAELNGLAPQVATLGKAQRNKRLADAAASVVARVTPYLEMFEQGDVARDLVAKVEQTIGAMIDLRAKQADVEYDGSDRVHRIKRLLLDALRYVGVAGQYVFDDDPTRAPAYRLQHVTSYWRPKKRKASTQAAPMLIAPAAPRNGADA